MKKQIDITSQYGHQISRAILIRCNQKESIGVNSLYDSDIYDIVDILAEQGIKATYVDVEQVLDKLIDSTKYLDTE